MTNCDTCQRTKSSKKKYGKISAKLSGEIPRNKLYVDIIGTYGIRRKVKKEKLDIKDVAVIDPGTRWFSIAQYENKISISAEKLVETTL